MHNNPRQSQFELFPGNSRFVEERSEDRKVLKEFTLSLDKALILSIAVIVTMVISFSLGVERGKGVVQRKVVPRLTVQKDNPVKQEIVEPEDPVKVNTQLEHVPVDTYDPLIAGISAEVNAGPMDHEVVHVEQNPQEFLSGVYTVQVASFKQEKYAREEATALEKKGYESIVVPKGNYSIVCVGKFDKHDQAKKYSVKLKNKYRDCLVRRL
jgi:cell division septation protein DedD